MRQSTVEPVFGTLLHHYGLRRPNLRGLDRAHQTMLLTALAYKLKRRLKHRPRQTHHLVVALPLPHPPASAQPWAQAARDERQVFCNSHGRFYRCIATALRDVSVCRCAMRLPSICILSHLYFVVTNRPN